MGGWVGEILLPRTEVFDERGGVFPVAGTVLNPRDEFGVGLGGWVGGWEGGRERTEVFDEGGGVLPVTRTVLYPSNDFGVGLEKTFNKGVGEAHARNLGDVVEIDTEPLGWVGGWVGLCFFGWVGGWVGGNYLSSATDSTTEAT